MYFDPEKGEWLAGDLRDAFARTVGPWRVTTHRGVHRMIDGQWQPLPNPFDNPRASTNFVTHRMIRDDRIMITNHGRHAEYDVTHDRWVYVLRAGWTSWFDDAGRRIFVGTGGMFVLEGDPFGSLTAEDDGAPDPQTQALSELLKLMDDARWRVREDATDELKRLFADIPSRLRAVLERDDLSVEVRMRVTLALEELLKENRAEGLVGEPLLRRMHPLLTPD